MATSEKSKMAKSKKSKSKKSSSKKKEIKKTTAKKPTVKSSNTSKKSGEDKKSHSSPVKTRVSTEVKAVIGLGVSLLFIIFVLTEKSSGIIGGHVATFMKHTFGMGAILIPLALIILCVKVLRGKDKSEGFKFKTLTVAAVLVIFLALAHIMTYSEKTAFNLKEFIRFVYLNGSLKNGGLIGGLIGGGLSKIIGQMGAYIVLIALFVVSILVVTGKSIRNGLNNIANWIDGVKEEADTYYEERSYEIEEREAEEEKEEKKEEKPLPSNIKVHKTKEKKPAPKGRSVNKRGVRVDIRIGERPKEETALILEKDIVNENNRIISQNHRPENVPELQSKIEEVKSGEESYELINIYEDMPDIDEDDFNKLKTENASAGSRFNKVLSENTGTAEEEDRRWQERKEKIEQTKRREFEQVSKREEAVQKSKEEPIEDIPVSDSAAEPDLPWLSDIEEDKPQLDVAPPVYDVTAGAQPKTPTESYGYSPIPAKEQYVRNINNDTPDVELSSDDDEAQKTMDEVNKTAQRQVSAQFAPGETPLVVATEEIKTVDKLSTENEVVEYKFPKLEFLGKNPDLGAKLDKEELLMGARKLVDTLSKFKIDIKVHHISKGPAITRYEIIPPEGMLVSKISNLETEIALGLAAKSVRIEAPIPGTSMIGIEIPNDKVSAVYFSEVLSSEKFNNSESKTTFGIGKDITGNVIVTDIAKMPHLLIAGATGSGKSVCVNSLITSILYKARPDEVKFILIDPKVVELSVYNGVPHLLVPVVTDPHKAAGALNWVCREMDRRYKLLSDYGVRNLDGYNKLFEQGEDEDPGKEIPTEKLPRIVVIVDELADLMLIAKKEVEASIMRITQLARAAGIYLVLATQRPSVNVITGVIKANVPSRIAFKVAQAIDSRTILDTNGAEKLLGKGDMLLMIAGMDKPKRVQGAFVTDEEVERIVDYIKVDTDTYDSEILREIERASEDASSSDSGSSDSENADLTMQSIEYVVNSKKASISALQRRFKIGYNKAASIMDELEERGIVGPDNGGTKGREILMDKYQYREWKERQRDY